MSTTAFGNAIEPRSSRPFVAHWLPERAVLMHLLDQYPRGLTVQELAREVGQGLRESVVQRAADNLTAARFVRREGAALIAAPAVVSFDREPTATEF
jgi:hypothetical protein